MTRLPGAWGSVLCAVCAFCGVLAADGGPQSGGRRDVAAAIEQVRKELDQARVKLGSLRKEITAARTGFSGEVAKLTADVTEKRKTWQRRVRLCDGVQEAEGISDLWR